jgi:hypothetical protein
MQILCAWIDPNPETLECFERYSPAGTEITWIERDDSQAYWKSVQEHWTGEEDLLIIEQDMKWEAGDIESVERCEYHWCSYEYPCFGSDDFTVKPISWALGFTRFSAALQQYYPVTAIQDNIDACDLPCNGSWIHLDMHIAATIKHGHCFCCRRIAPHVHGTVEHLHDYSSPEAVLPDKIDKLSTENLAEQLRARGWTVADPGRIRVPDGVTELQAGTTKTVVVNHVQRAS